MRVGPQERRRSGSIAEQLVAHDVDVLLGGGAARFDQLTDAGPTVSELAAQRGYRVLRSRQALAAASGFGKLLGLFAAGNMSTELTGNHAVPYPSNSAAPQTCRAQVRGADEPTLAEMTATALRVLGQPAGDGPGFFLQVEGAHIDKQDHQADPCGQVGDTVGFDRAVQLGLDYAAGHPDTLVIVTADHGTRARWFRAAPTATNHPPGAISSLRTADGATITVSYGTNLPGRIRPTPAPRSGWPRTQPQAANVLGLSNQTDLFRLLLSAMGGAVPTAAAATP